MWPIPIFRECRRWLQFLYLLRGDLVLRLTALENLFEIFADLLLLLSGKLRRRRMNPQPPAQSRLPEILPSHGPNLLQGGSVMFGAAPSHYQGSTLPR